MSWLPGTTWILVSFPEGNKEWNLKMKKCNFKLKWNMIAGTFGHSTQTPREGTRDPRQRGRQGRIRAEDWNKSGLSGTPWNSKEEPVITILLIKHLTYASATPYVVCQTSGPSWTQVDGCLPRPLLSWTLLMRRWGKSTARGRGSRPGTRSRREYRGGKGEPCSPTSLCVDAFLEI